MKKTTAKVEHRDYVPWGWIAIEFCNVYFYGYRAHVMTKRWDDIKLVRYKEYESVCKENEVKIQNMRAEMDSIYKQVKEAKPFYRFWYNKSEQEMLDKAHELSDQIHKLEEENEKLKAKRFFDVYECHREIENLLQFNGFILTDTSSRGEECVTKTEIWTLEEK